MRGDTTGGKTGGWLGAYKINHIEDDAERQRRWPRWIAAIGDIGPELWRLVGRKLNAALKDAGVKPGARVVWTPAGALGILPLGLAQDPKSGRRLADNYEIVYAPSLEALIEARRRIAKAAPRATLGLIVNPTGDLPGPHRAPPTRIRTSGRVLSIRGYDCLAARGRHPGPRLAHGNDSFCRVGPGSFTPSPSQIRT